MAQTVQVPLTGSNVTPSEAAPQATQPERETGFVNNVYVPPASRVGIHKTRLGQSIAKQVEQQSETAPTWVDNRNGNGGRFEHRPVERTEPQPERSSPSPTPQPPTQPNDAISQQLSQLTQAVTMLAQHQLGIEPDTGPRMPDPAQFDFYDPQSEGEYHQALQKYVEDTVQQRLQAEFEPYKPALTGIQKQQEMESHFNELRDTHGQEPHFRTTMMAALQMVADSNNQLSIKDAYAKADSRDNRPGERGGHLPKALTGGKFPKFGAILQHNQMSGRSGR